MAVVTVPAVTENVFEIEPWGMVTLAGTVAAAEEALTAITAPPLGAADVSETVQVDPAEGVIVAGLQERPASADACKIVTVPLLVVVGMAAPEESAETPFVNCTVEDASVVDAASVRVTLATMLLGMLDELRPHTKQVAVPEPLLQERLLPEEPGPAAILAVVKAVVE